MSVNRSGLYVGLMVLAAAVAGYMVSRQLAQGAPALVSGTALPPRPVASFLLKDHLGANFGNDRLKGSPRLSADETRPWGGSHPPGVAYVYATDRKAERPIAHLNGVTGILQVDGYSGYKVLSRQNDVQLAFCWSNVRRKFYELPHPVPRR